MPPPATTSLDSAQNDSGILSGALSPELAAALQDAAAGPEIASVMPQQGVAGILAVAVRDGTHTLATGVPIEAAVSIYSHGMHRVDALRTLAATARALAKLHAQHRIHGAVGPAWILRDREGNPWLATPALAVNATTVLQASLRSPVPGPSAFAFAAPEVVAGASITPAADVYSLAAVAYHVLTGSLPLGQLDMNRTLSNLPLPHRYVLGHALQADVSLRPAPGVLAGSLDAIAGTQPAIASAEGAPRSELSAILVIVLLVGGFFVLSGAIWLVAKGWDQLGGEGRLALLLVLTAGVGGAGEWAVIRRYPRTGIALLTVATQLLFADGAYLLSRQGTTDAGHWTVLSGIVSAIALAIALHRRSSILAVAATIDVAITAGCLGAHLHTGWPPGLALYTASVAIACIVLAAGCEALAGTAVASPMGVAAALSLATSALAALLLVNDAQYNLFGTLWPYAVAVIALLPAVAGVRRPYSSAGVFVTALTLAIAPTAQALARDQSLVYLLAAVVVGAGVVTASVVVPEGLRAQMDETLTCIAGVTSMVVAAGIAALRRLQEPGEVQSVAIALVVSVITVALAFGISYRAARKESYRAVESAGLVLFYGVLTAASIEHISDYLWPACLLGGGGVALAVGVLARRATLVAISACALILNVWVQYFGKLRDVLPVSLLMVGFGLSVLAFGFAFERKVREFLPRLREWA